MLISELIEGDKSCFDQSEICARLALRNKDGLNEFWVSFDDMPCLAILAKDDLAYIIYFPYQGHPGFVAQNSSPTLDDVLYLSISGNEYELEPDCILPFESAVSAVLYFFEHQTNDPTLSWQEL